MDMIERRIRDAVATVLSRGAKALEQTASELERAASELRTAAGAAGPDRLWSEPATDGETRRTTRGAPLRVVPDTPTDAADAPSYVPPVRPPQVPTDERPGAVDADVTADPVMDLDGSGPERASSDEAAVAGDIVAEPSDHSAPVGETADMGADAEAATASRLRDLADGTVSSIRAQLGDLSDDELHELREIETGNRNRVTLLSAIDRELDREVH